MSEIEYTIEINPIQSYNIELNEQGPQGLRGFTGPQGPQGIQGIQGDDGFSPIATVSQEGNVTTITITDKEGTTTESIDLSSIVGDIDDINTLLATYGNIVTHNVSEFATAAQGALADTALQPNDNITELVNNVGYITSSALTPYVLSTDLASVATSGSYNDLTNKPTIPTVPTNVSEFTNDAGYITNSALNGYATEQWIGQQGYITNSVNNLTNYYTKAEIDNTIGDIETTLHNINSGV